MLLADYLGKAQVKGDVGIEVEVEGKRLPNNGLVENSKYWKAVEDGSLRNGMEYIYRGATPIGEVGKSIDELNYMFAKANTELQFSFRTSVHVHVNCLPLTVTQVKNFIYLYLILEPVLLEYCGEIRKGNRFCLRLVDAEGLMRTLSDMFRGNSFGRMLNAIINDQNRYAALNVQSLKEHGTLEIRSMQGTADKDTIVTWANALISLRENAKLFKSPKEIFEMLQRVGINFFVKKILGDDAKWFMYGDYENDILRNISLAYDLPHIVCDEAQEAPKVKAKEKFQFDLAAAVEEIRRENALRPALRPADDIPF